MSCHLLLFVQTNTPLAAEVGLRVAVEEGWTCNRVSLEAANRGDIRRMCAQGALVVAGANSVEIVPYLTRVRALCRELPLAAILPAAIDGKVLEAVNEIVADFVLWPPHQGELRLRIQRLFTQHGSSAEAVSERLTLDLGFAQFVGQDPVFLKAVEKIPLMAKSGAPVIITGETGTGKELGARAIHHLSARRDLPFIAIDCVNLPEHLVENELFGHAKGAFTDAHSDQIGLIALANKGTLFLDEVDTLPLGTQAKLLRFLQERTFKPLGSERFVKADISVIAATNRDLEACVARKEFRADLYYRLNVFRLRLPPLRERVSDIRLLARHFLDELSEPGARKTLSPEALRRLEGHSWPGNVRELGNVIRQAAAFAGGTLIAAEDILLPATAEHAGHESATFRDGKARIVAAFERSFVEELLRKHGGNVTHAAREAHKDRRTLGRLIKKYDIDPMQG